MTDIPYRKALIIGAGSCISGSLTCLLQSAGMPVVIAVRNTDKLASLVDETAAIALKVDASDAAAVERLFVKTEARTRAPKIVICNAIEWVGGLADDADLVQE